VLVNPSKAERGYNYSMHLPFFLFTAMCNTFIIATSFTSNLCLFTLSAELRKKTKSKRPSIKSLFGKNKHPYYFPFLYYISIFLSNKNIDDIIDMVKFLLLYDTAEDESSKTSSNQPVRGSFLNLLPPQMEVPEKNESQ
jgi:hypothetical protein